MPIETFWTFAALLLAGRKIAIATGAAEYGETLAELMENGNRLNAALRESGLGPLAREMERKANAALSFTHPGPARDDAQAIFWQVAPVALADRDTLAAANLDPKTACDRMIAAIKASDPRGEFAPRPICEQYFSAIVVPLLKTMVADATYMTGLTPTLWREALTRQGITIDIAERTESKVDDLNARVTELTAQLAKMQETRAARESGVSEKALIRLVHPIAEDVEDTAQALIELANAVTIAARVQQECRHGSNLGDFLDEVLRRRAELSAAGEHSAAISEIDGALAREEAESSARRVRLLNAAVDEHLLQRDAVGAAARIAARVNAETTDPTARFSSLFREQNTWVTRGRDRGLNLDLDVAIQLGWIVVTIATDSKQKGVALSDLGSALLTRGQRESNNGRLEEALEVFGAALQELDSAETRHLWVGTMINFGVTLSALGERATGTERLLDAINAFEAAIKEIPPEQRPLDWAMANIQLGNVLSTLGQRVPGSSYLDDAVRTFERALPFIDRESTPKQWSSAQNDLGKTHASLGERGPGTRHLKKAVRAFRSALEERIPSTDWMEYAITQNNLGNALQELGKRLHDPEKLRDAVKAYEESLTARTQETAPYQWANTQSNLGNALTALGVEEAGSDNFETAIIAFRKALIEITRARSAQQWTIIQMNLADAFRNFGEQELSIDSLVESISISQEIIDQSKREEIPLLWANTVGNQGWTRLSLAEITQDAPMAMTSLSQLHEASRQLRAIGHPHWAETFERLILVAEGLVEKLSRPA